MDAGQPRSSAAGGFGGAEPEPKAWESWPCPSALSSFQQLESRLHGACPAIPSPPAGLGRALWSDWLAFSVCVINTCIVHGTQSHCLTGPGAPSHPAPACRSPVSPQEAAPNLIFIFPLSSSGRECATFQVGAQVTDTEPAFARALTLGPRLRGELPRTERVVSLDSARCRACVCPEQGLPGAVWLSSWTLNLREAPRMRQKTGEEILGRRPCPGNINSNLHP